MFCRNCGTKLPENSKFCPACGTPTGYIPPVEEVKEAVEEIKEAVEAPVEEIKETVEAPVEEIKEAAEEALEAVSEAPAEPVEQPIPPFPYDVSTERSDPPLQFQDHYPMSPLQQPVPVFDPTQPEINPAQPVVTAPAQPAYAAPAYAPVQEQPKKKNSGLLPLLIALGAVVVIAALLVTLVVPKLFGGRSTGSIAPIDHLFAFINDGEADDLFAALQPEFIEALANEAGMSTEAAKILIAQSIRTAMTSYADGKITASYVVQGSEPLDEDDLDELRYELEYYYGIDSSGLTEAVVYDIAATLTVGTETEIESEDFISYCYNDDWYIWLF